LFALSQHRLRAFFVARPHLAHHEPGLRRHRLPALVTIPGIALLLLAFSRMIYEALRPIPVVRDWLI